MPELADQRVETMPTIVKSYIHLLAETAAMFLLRDGHHSAETWDRVTEELRRDFTELILRGRVDV